MQLRLRYNAPVILTFAIVAVVVHMLGAAVTTAFFAAPPNIAWGNPLNYLRLVTHVIGHTSWSHLSGNFLFILVIGPMLEERYGSGILLTLCIVTAAVTGVINAALFSNGLLGASGIVFMLILLSSFTNVHEGEIPITSVLVAALFIPKEIIASLQEDKVAQFAHILGGCCGGAFGALLTRNRSTRNAAHGGGST